MKIINFAQQKHIHGNVCAGNVTGNVSVSAVNKLSQPTIQMCQPNLGRHSQPLNLQLLLKVFNG